MVHSPGPGSHAALLLNIAVGLRGQRVHDMQIMLHIFLFIASKEIINYGWALAYHYPPQHDHAVDLAAFRIARGRG
jgi:hypothetical protein